jgi:HD-GYP domain-containing protein (c-di-GMP phosphodiesterase class II)
MTELEQRILAVLDDLDSMVKTRPLPNLLPVFSRLDELARQLPKQTDPQLLHFLKKKSYEKARLLLRGRDAENARGTCS